MIFQVFEKGQLRRIFDSLAARYEVVGPVELERRPGGEPLFAFRPVASFDELRLDYTTTHTSAKSWFLPHVDELATFRIDGKDWEKSVDPNTDRVRVYFGLHPCDINALNKLDKVLLSTEYPVPWYASKRRNSFIVGIDCSPLPTCFCRSMGSDTVIHGFDMFLTDLGDEWFAEILTARAFQVTAGIPRTEVTEAHHARYQHAITARKGKFEAVVDTTDLTKILDMEFRSPVWKKWGERCLGCGSCAGVCPTCYCYGVEEEVSLDLARAEKVKRLHSCSLVDFAEVAGGHNFRPERGIRLKYRYYHKHRGFVEAFEEPLCVGCGRCGKTCLADITVPDVISSVRHQEG